MAATFCVETKQNKRITQLQENGVLNLAAFQKAVRQLRQQREEKRRSASQEEAKHVVQKLALGERHRGGGPKLEPGSPKAMAGGGQLTLQRRFTEDDIGVSQM